MFGMPLRLMSPLVNTVVCAGTLARSTPDPRSGVGAITSTVGRVMVGGSVRGGRRRGRLRSDGDGRQCQDRSEHNQRTITPRHDMPPV